MGKESNNGNGSDESLRKVSYRWKLIVHPEKKIQINQDGSVDSTQGWFSNLIFTSPQKWIKRFICQNSQDRNSSKVKYILVFEPTVIILELCKFYELVRTTCKK